MANLRVKTCPYDLMGYFYIVEKSQLEIFLDNKFAGIVDAMSKVLFYDIAGFPLIVLWLIIGGVFFTVRLGFVNISMFRHGLKVVTGRYDNPSDPGQISHFQALSAAVSATVGLGNIAGVAFAVSLGGPGAVFWLVVAGFFGMSLKFAEVTLGQKYRTIDENGRVMGGAFQYLSKGLAELNMPKFGKILSLIFAFCCIFGAFGAGGMFQANQSVKLITNTYSFLTDMKVAFSIALAILVGTVLIGGITRIASVASKIVPLMAVLYIAACLVVLFVNFSLIPNAIMIIFEDAFTGKAVAGSMVGVLVMGFRRAVFSNEAGLGSAPIAHSAARTKEPVREGCVALLEPFLDTIVICFMTGLVITVTGVYTSDLGETDSTAKGVLLTSYAFSTVSSWFPYVLSVCVFLFAFSTMITWSYYGEIAWRYLFGKKLVTLYHLLFVLVVFMGGIVKATTILDFADLLLLVMAFPNILGLYLLSGKIKEELASYKAKLASGKFD